MLQVAICDDDKVLCYKLEEMITKVLSVCNEKVSIDIFFDGKNLCDYMKQEHTFDVIFLDIEMENMNGVLVGHEIREVLKNDDVELIYISATDKYAKKLFDTDPLNFLKKPITEEKLSDVLMKLRRLLKRNNKLFHYSVNRQIYAISFKKILFFEVINRKILIHTKNEDEMYYGKLSEVEEQVKGQRFLKISRSQLVNFDAIDTYQQDKITLQDGQQLYIAGARQKEVQKQIILYSREEM